MRTSPDSRPTTPAIGGRPVGGEPPVATAAVGTPPRRVLRILVRDALLARVLIRLIGLGHLVGAAAAVGHRKASPWSLCRRARSHRRSPPTHGPSAQWGTLGDAVEDHEDLRGTAVGPCRAVPVKALKTRPQAPHW